MKFFCWHNYEVKFLDLTYNTSFSKTEKIFHILKFKECSKCGKRNFESSYYKDLSFVYKPEQHIGIERAKIIWLQNGKPTINAERVQELTKPKLININEYR